MATYVAFLRAINLGAKRKFPKDDIVRVTEAAGFADVATHINTGNVRLGTAMRSRARIEQALEEAYLADRGFEVPTVVYSQAELREVAEHAAGIEHDGHHYVALLRDDPTEKGLARLREKARPEVREVAYDGAAAARPAPGLLAAIRDAEAVVVCCSNPVTRSAGWPAGSSCRWATSTTPRRPHGPSRPSTVCVGRSPATRPGCCPTAASNCSAGIR